jgi:hypothetical protein
MSTAIGGSIESITLSGRTLAVTGDAEANRRKGGWENEVAMNGDGKTARLIKTRKGWRLAGVAVVIDDAQGDQEYLQELADRNDFFSVGITYGSGVIYQGSGQIVGEIVQGSASASATIDLEGPGQLEPQ